MKDATDVVGYVFLMLIYTCLLAFGVWGMTSMEALRKFKDEGMSKGYLEEIIVNHKIELRWK